MKTVRSIVVTAALAGTLAGAAFVAAGPLNPPAGPVAPTLKTLAEVEPRIAVNAANTPGDATSMFKITQPGSYYLTGNLTGVPGKNGVTIEASGVTLDLAGFTLVGVPGSLDGASVSGSLKNVKVHNGTVQGWGDDGIDLASTWASIVERVASSDNSAAGIRAGGRSRVADCVTRANSSDNIIVNGFSLVTDCIADGSAGGHGINASFVSSIVSRCAASANGLSGIRAAQRTLVQDCVSTANGLHGVHITFIGVVENCMISDNLGGGILMDDGGAVTIRNNTTAGSVTNAGIRVANSSGNHIEGNSVTFCQTGVLVTSFHNTIVRNSAMSNTAANFSVVAPNVFGPAVTPATAATATNPLANYSN